MTAEEQMDGEVKDRGKETLEETWELNFSSFLRDFVSWVSRNSGRGWRDAVSM